MATYQKRGKGWKASVRRKGISKSKTFHTKARAVAWASKLEAEILDGTHAVAKNKTFGDLLERYELTVSKKKKGYIWEAKRIGLFRRDKIAEYKLAELTPSVMADWRDRRLEEVQPASVRREWNILNHAINIAIKEWEWLSVNPLKNIERPEPAKPRDRLYTENEIERLIYAAGYDYAPPKTITAKVAAAFLFAIETGMRAGEIASLRPNRIDLDQKVARLDETKNGFPRDVPLSDEAVRLLTELDSGYFELTSMQISSLFKKIRKRALIEDATFHDSRHLAITRLAKKLDILDLARMMGIRDLKILMVYYNEKAADIAKKL